MLNMPQARIVIVLRDNATIMISNITYTKTQMPGVLQQIRNISDITMISQSVVNLSDFFSETHGIRKIFFGQIFFIKSLVSVNS